MKVLIYCFFVLILALLGWRMNMLLNPTQKIPKNTLAPPVEPKKSEVQEWIRIRDLQEKRSQQQVPIGLED